MNRRSFLRVLGLAPLVAVAGSVIGPILSRGAVLDKRPLLTVEEEVKEWLAEIEQRVGVGKEGDSAICLENNKPYKTITWTKTGNCIKPEGLSAAKFLTSDAAWIFWFAAFKVYHNKHGGKIHWRMRPRIWGPSMGGDTWETRNDRRFTGYVVSARLVADDL